MLCLSTTPIIIEQITLGQILVSVTFIVGIITARKKIKETIKEWFSDNLNPKLDPIESNLKKLCEQVKSLEIDSYKQYLVLFLSNVERGDIPDESERAFFDEIYTKYINCGGNSYIKRKREKLEKEGKL